MMRRRMKALVASTLPKKPNHDYADFLVKTIYRIASRGDD